mmetsp:Transcript_27438/g.27315  ORF Transcript_27438/g.27315 Transcript_27438/m.27315 type:complete len:259 (-) Transcript_27438:243-1019(-)
MAATQGFCTGPQVPSALQVLVGVPVVARRQVPVAVVREGVAEKEEVPEMVAGHVLRVQEPWTSAAHVPLGWQNLLASPEKPAAQMPKVEEPPKALGHMTLFWVAAGQAEEGTTQLTSMSPKPSAVQGALISGTVPAGQVKLPSPPTEVWGIEPPFSTVAGQVGLKVQRGGTKPAGQSQVKTGLSGRPMQTPSLRQGAEQQEAKRETWTVLEASPSRVTVSGAVARPEGSERGREQRSWKLLILTAAVVSLPTLQEREP